DETASNQLKFKLIEIPSAGGAKLERITSAEGATTVTTQLLTVYGAGNETTGLVSKGDRLLWTPPADTNGSNSVNAGDTITYTITVENTGNVTVDSITLTDTLLDADGGALSLTTAPAFSGTTKGGAAGPNNATEGTLAPGEVASYTATYVIGQAAIDAGGVSNTVIAKGKDPSDNDVSDDSDNGDETKDDDGDEDPTKDPTKTPIDQLPAQTISKRVASNSDEEESNDISLGDTLTYSVVATNSGNTTLTNMVVTDEKLNPTTITCASVAPEDTCELAGTYTVTQADIDAGEILNNAQVVSDEVDEPTKTTLKTPVEQKPAITIEKRLAEEQEADYAVGDTIGFEIVATNTGNQTLTAVTIKDSMITPAEKVCETVAPAETCVLAGSYTVTQADKDAGEVTNEATVTSDQTPLPKKAVLTTGLVQNRKPTLTKTLASHLDKDEDNTISVGDILSFEVTLLNDGDITLTQVNVKDNKISPSSQSCPRIEPGESCVLKGAY
ncbi:MAG: DUF11 domain-containing protein, partial [Gammaproteobacteria bacterium]|nr:DUF11 domain-containing protein [Gammaproteobacteria bacterium]